MRKAPQMQAEALEALCELLALMRAVQWNHLTTHWQVSGENFYSDHKLFNKLYNSLQEDVDTLAEKMVCYFKAASVDSIDQATRMQKILIQATETNLIARAIRLEKMLLAQLALSFDILSQSGMLSLGLDDFISATASSHERNLYLLTQRNQ